MGMLGQDFKVWHDACHDGIRSGDAIHAIQGCGTGSHDWQVYQGELAKIKRVIDHLPATTHDVGMVLFAPEFAVRRKSMLRVRALLWGVFMAGWPSRLKSPDQCLRAYAILRIAIDEAKHSYHRAHTDKAYDCSSKYSHRDIATLLEVKHQNIERDWMPVIAAMCAVLADYADKALSPIREEIELINRKYKKVA